MDRDWTDLLPELLQLISKKLTSISDFIRIRAVCKTWKTALSPPSDHLPPLLPWLILPRGPDDGEDANLGSSLSMYDLSQSRTHILDLPAIQGKCICGSSHGWLILEKQRDVWLLNPITRDEISLPSLSVQPNTFQRNTKGVVIHSDLRFCIKKAILSSNPRMDSNCLVMALFSGNWETAFCRVGDKCWTTVYVQGNTAPESPIVDIGYHNSFYYAVCRNGHVWICNICDPHLNSVSSYMFEACICTVEGCGDEYRLMALFYHYWLEKLRLFMLSEEEKQWLLVDQEHSGSDIFFLGGLFHCIAIPAASLQQEGWEGGSICYINCDFAGMVGGVDWYSCSIRRYRVNDASATSILVSHLDNIFDRNNYCRHLTSPSFLWHTPTLS